MADKDLRKMNRTELIEIIYVLQQDEKALQKQNDDLRQQLDDSLARIQETGTIEETTQNLNHIMEDIQSSSRQYLDSLQAFIASGDERAREIIKEAQEQAGKMLEETNEQTRKLLEETREQTRKLLADTSEQAGKIMQQEAQEEARKVLADAREQAQKMQQEAYDQAQKVLEDAHRQAEIAEIVRLKIQKMQEQGIIIQPYTRKQMKTALEKAEKQVRIALGKAEKQAKIALEEAGRQSQKILTDVQGFRRRAQKECRQFAGTANRKAQKQRAAFGQEISRFLMKYPELGKYLGK